MSSPPEQESEGSVPSAGGFALPPGGADDYEEAAVRARIAARLFGAGPAVVRIGRYEVVDRIGAGGMGVVYSARDPELDRLVALKVLTSERSGDPRHRQRLVGEAQTLARLSHPNVVQIYEVGEQEGATFLALELVHGETLATWQRRPERRWQEVLAAYIDAARGLAAAHEVGVVHRDVKPNNILVGADGRVRVVDFGLARATPGDLQTTSTATATSTGAGVSITGAIAGTPAYMSPEQACGRGVDARTDIFSLCVSLFEGLFGRRPFEAHELRGLSEHSRLAVKRLRARIPRSSPVPGWVLPILAAGLQPDVLRRTGELRGFIAALERAPQRRRLHRTLAGAALGLGLGAWSLRTGSGTPVCPELVDALAGAWDPSHKAEIRAQFIASQLPFAEDAWQQTERSLDAAIFAWARERRDSCIRTHVDRSQSAEQFDLAAECLGDHERSLRERIARLRVAGPAEVTQAHVLVRGVADPTVCTNTDALRRGPMASTSEAVRERVAALRGELDRLRILIGLGELREATELAESLAAQSAIHGPMQAEVQHLQGVIAARRGDLKSAGRWFTTALAAAEEHRDDRLAAVIAGEQTELAVHGLRELDTARIHAALYGAKLRRIAASAPLRAEYLDRLGELELVAGDPAAALTHHKEANRLYAEDDPVGRARSLKGMANALGELGRSAESVEQLQVARDLLASELGDAHPMTAAVDFDIALSLRDRPDRTPGDLDRALALLRSTLVVEARHGDADGVAVARTRTAIALVLHDRGEIEEAVSELERGLPVLRAQLPPTHVDLATALALAVNVHIERRAWGPAAEACIALIRLHRTRGEPIPFALLFNAGEFSLRQGEVLAAIPYYDQALTAASSDDPPDPSLLAHALGGRGKVYLAQGELALARALFERALSLLAAIDPPIAALTAEVSWGAAQARAADGREREAAGALAAQALAAFREADPEAPEIPVITAFLASRSRGPRK